jgi:hypothetical protein
MIALTLRLESQKQNLPFLNDAKSCC